MKRMRLTIILTVLLLIWSNDCQLLFGGVLGGVTIPNIIAPFNTLINLKNSNQTFSPINQMEMFNRTIGAHYFTLVNLPLNRIVVLNISEVMMNNCNHTTSLCASRLIFVIRNNAWPNAQKYDMIITPNTNFTLYIKSANDSTFYSIGVFKRSTTPSTIDNDEEYMYLFQLDVVDSIDMPEYIFAIIMICSGLVASIMFLITLIQSGVSMSFVLGVDFFSLCYRRGKKGYSQINVNIPEEE